MRHPAPPAALALGPGVQALSLGEPHQLIKLAQNSTEGCFTRLVTSSGPVGDQASTGMRMGSRATHQNGLGGEKGRGGRWR